MTNPFQFGNPPDSPSVQKYVEENRKFTRLNARQEAFCRLVAIKGISATTAYMAAYNPASRDTARNGGPALMRKPKIAKRIEELRNEKAEVELHDAKLARDYIIRRLMFEAERGDNSAARIRALELLGKMSHVRLFDPPRDSNTEQIRSSDEVKTALQQRLNRLLPSDSEANS